MKRWQFWLIIVPMFAWIGRDGLRSQSRIDPDQIRLNLPPVAAIIRAEALVPQSPDGSYMLPIPMTPPGTNQSVTVTIWAVTVYRNSTRQNGGSDYNMDPANGFRFIPSTAWLPSDTVLVDYWSGVKTPVALRSVTSTTSPKVTTIQKIGRFLKREYPQQ